MNGMTPAPQPGFGREQWTTCHLDRLSVGDILAWRGPKLRPAVVTATRTEGAGREKRDQIVTGTVRYLDTGEEAPFTVRAATSVAVRCDLRYAATRAEAA